MNTAVCVDVGSTYTKAALISLADGALVSRAEVPTTSASDVLTGLDEAVAAVGGSDAPLYVCSSAGGGLRLAVVGYEALVTASAGHRVGLSAGAQVVHVAAGLLDGRGIAALKAARPDVILLVGGTDGGDAAVLLHNARRLGNARLRVPVVLAGNADARDEAAALLRGSSPADPLGPPKSRVGGGGRAEKGPPPSARKSDGARKSDISVVTASNVLPRIGVLDPMPARAAIREVFLRHVIGGKRLSRGGRFASLVRAATPDAVLAGVSLLAGVTGAGVLVVDVGGATTDVYSALIPDAEAENGPRRDVAGTLWHARTVEGDLGVAAGAGGTVAAATAERVSLPKLALPETGQRPDPERDRDLAAAAAMIALRRHARGHSPGPGEPRTGGRDLRDVRLVVGSGGVLRHGGGGYVLDAVLADTAGGWAAPTTARRVVDERYVLAAAGLLSIDHRDAAISLLNSL